MTTFREKMLEEADHRCSKCGAEHPKLHLHHRKPRALYPELVFDKKNIEVLCPSCHRYLESRGEYQLPLLILGGENINVRYFNENEDEKWLRIARSIRSEGRLSRYGWMVLARLELKDLGVRKGEKLAG